MAALHVTERRQEVPIPVTNFVVLVELALGAVGTGSPRVCALAAVRSVVKQPPEAGVGDGFDLGLPGGHVRHTLVERVGFAGTLAWTGWGRCGRGGSGGCVAALQPPPCERHCAPDLFLDGVREIHAVQTVQQVVRVQSPHHPPQSAFDDILDILCVVVDGEQRIRTMRSHLHSSALTSAIWRPLQRSLHGVKELFQVGPIAHAGEGIPGCVGHQDPS
mmetsp:Transcript_38258/g.109251  ORF Transcript_38258/g.109251 Transcript_38258/m.109251 type:complete len:218 (+) Transcript_38258:94-747(+)